MPVLAAVPCQPTASSWRAGIVAESAAMRLLIDQVARIAPSAIPILILGETGSGKDLVARALHDASGRIGPFVTINCAALPAPLVESELFGHRRGAFTDAHREMRGLVAQADHGTMLLNEIGELDLHIQAKLLHVVEQGTVRALGTTEERWVDVRFVAATNRDLEAEVHAGQFREDLYHRIAGVVLNIPPLHEHREDIPALVEKFLEESCEGRPILRLASGTISWLTKQPWPGNVRELRQAVHRAVLLGGAVLMPEDFHLREQPRAAETTATYGFEGKTFAEVERELCIWALGRCGSIRAAAQALAVPRSTLSDKLARYGIDARAVIAARPVPDAAE